MFDIDAGKILVVGVVALLVIGPKDLPRVLRTVGQTVGKMRRMATEFQNQFMEAIKEADLEDVKKEISAIDESAQIDGSFDPASLMRHEITTAVEGPGEIGQSVVDLTGAPDASAPAPTKDIGEPIPEPAARIRSARTGAGKGRSAGERGRDRPERRRGGRSGRAGMTDADIEATKAPLMDHLIELRARLIRALLAFFVAFLVCFYFSRGIYNVLTEPYVRVVGAENAKLIATHFLEQFYTNIQLSMFGAGVIAFPMIAQQIYKFVAPGLYKHEKAGVLSLPHRDADLFRARRDCSSISSSCRC